MNRVALESISSQIRDLQGFAELLAALSSSST